MQPQQTNPAAPEPTVQQPPQEIATAPANMQAPVDVQQSDQPPATVAEPAPVVPNPTEAVAQETAPAKIAKNAQPPKSGATIIITAAVVVCGLLLVATILAYMQG